MTSSQAAGYCHTSYTERIQKLLSVVRFEMRSSRLSRDTAKLLAATRAHTPLRPTRRAAIRDYSLNTVDAGRVAHGPNEVAGSADNGDEQSESESSPVPDQDVRSGQTKKRKRGQSTPVATHDPVVAKDEIKDEIKQEVKLETTETVIAAIASPPRNTHGQLKKAPRAPAKKVKRADGSITVEPPPHWEEVYALTREMRNENVAPVDTMGCASLADRNASPRDQRWQTLVSLMLSSQTKDTVTSVAIKNMQQNMPGVSARLRKQDAGKTPADDPRDSVWNPSSRSTLLN